MTYSEIMAAVVRINKGKITPEKLVEETDKYYLTLLVDGEVFIKPIEKASGELVAKVKEEK